MKFIFSLKTNTATPSFVATTCCIFRQRVRDDKKIESEKNPEITANFCFSFQLMRLPGHTGKKTHTHLALVSRHKIMNF